MVKIGLCGGIGSGKSTVALVFETLGYHVYYSDNEAKRLMGSLLKSQIIELLGCDAYTVTGELNRPHISSVIFSNKELLDKLNKIVHPAVENDFKSWVEQQNSEIVVQEAALLIESGAYKSLDKVILVTAPIETRIKRTILRDNLTAEQVISKIKTQLSYEETLQYCDFVINSHNNFVVKQVLDIVKKLLPL